MKSCMSCEWRKPLLNPQTKLLDRSVCRYNPPQIFGVFIQGPQGQAVPLNATAWPIVTEDDFCSKYSPSFSMDQTKL